MPGTPHHNILRCYFHSPPLDEGMEIQRHVQAPRAGKWQVRAGLGLFLPGATLLPGTLDKAIAEPRIFSPPFGRVLSPLAPACWQVGRQNSWLGGGNPNTSSMVILRVAPDELGECSLQDVNAKTQGSRAWSPCAPRKERFRGPFYNWAHVPASCPRSPSASWFSRQVWMGQLPAVGK